MKTLRVQYKKYIKEAVDVYIRKMIKNLGDKVFKHYIYIKHYNIVLDLV